MVVTGAGGYIGAVLVDALVKNSCRVLRISRGDLVAIADTQTMKADIRNPDAWSYIVEQADVVYHLAGNTSAYEAARNPAESLNSTLLPLNHLVNAAQVQCRKPRVIFASTATVYGLTHQLPVDETVEATPITIYDLHKLFAEQQLALATKSGYLDGISLRLANVYGPSSSLSSADDRGILNRVTAMALQGRDLTVYGDGNYLRDYVYIDDVVEAFMLAGFSKDVCGGVFNVATGRSVTVSAAFHMVATRAAIATGNTINVKNAPWPEGAGAIEFRNYVANINAISEELGWRPAVSLESGIDRLIRKIRNDSNGGSNRITT